MDFLKEFMRSRADLKLKSPEGYEYEIEVRLKDITKDEFLKLPKISDIITTEETLYSVKGSNIVMVRKVGSNFFIKEKISSKMICKFNAEVVLSLERKYHGEQGMALKIVRHKERGTTYYDGFRVDATKVTSSNKVHYEIELEVLDDTCDIRHIEDTLESIRPSSGPEVCKRITKLVPSFNPRNYRFPKPIDITVRELARQYSSGGSISLKLDGVRSFITCYKESIYEISTGGHEKTIGSSIHGDNSFTVLDTERVDDMYYAFDIIIIKDRVVAHLSLEERIKMIPQVCLGINKAIKRKLIVAKKHFMFKDFNAFSRYHQILEKKIQEEKYDGLIYTHGLSYFDQVMRWKPQKTVDLLYKDRTLMAYNQREVVDSSFRMSSNSKIPNEDTISEFIIDSSRHVTLLRERKDKTYPNSTTVIERIKKIVKEEKDIFRVFKGLTVSLIKSYHNDVKRELLKKGTGHLLDIGSSFGGDVTKWGHYTSITCVEPSHTNIKEFKQRLGNNKKVKIIQARIEHLRGFDKSITTIACFFCVTLIDINKLVKIIQKVSSDEHTCTFLCIVMSKKYVMKFFEAKNSKEHICEAYTIKLKDDGSMYVHIPGTIVLDQTERLVDVDNLIAQLESIGFKLGERHRLNSNRFMSSNEYVLSSMYESLVMTR